MTCVCVVRLCMCACKQCPIYVCMVSFSVRCAQLITGNCHLRRKTAVVAKLTHSDIFKVAAINDKQVFHFGQDEKTTNFEKTNKMTILSLPDHLWNWGQAQMSKKVFSDTDCVARGCVS